MAGHTFPLIVGMQVVSPLRTGKVLQPFQFPLLCGQLSQHLKQEAAGGAASHIHHTSHQCRCSYLCVSKVITSG